MTPSMELRSPVTLETQDGQVIPLNYKIEQLPEHPDEQVAATIQRMNSFVCADAQSAPVLVDARLALRANPNDPLGSIHSFVRERMTFVKDEETAEPFTSFLPKPGDYFVEALTRPVDVSLQYAATRQPVKGDCDDFSMYTAALLRSLGIECAFATIAAVREAPMTFSHVYVIAYFRGAKVPMDCSHGPKAGWQAPNIFRYQEWPIFDRSAYGAVGAALLGLGWLAWRNRSAIRELFS